MLRVGLGTTNPYAMKFKTNPACQGTDCKNEGSKPEGNGTPKDKNSDNIVTAEEQKRLEEKTAPTPSEEVAAPESLGKKEQSLGFDTVRKSFKGMTFTGNQVGVKPGEAGRVSEKSSTAGLEKQAHAINYVV